MITIMDLLQDAEPLSLGEMRIISGQRPVFRMKKGWHPLNSECLSPTWVREQIFSLLDEAGRVNLLKNGCVQAAFTLQGRRIAMTASKSAAGFHAYFSWQNQEIALQDFYLPAAVIEILKKSNGLSVISGPRTSGKSTLSRFLAQEISSSGSRSVGIFTDQPEEYLNTKSQDSDWQIFSSEMINHPGITAGLDFMVVDSARAAAWRHAVVLAEKGVPVLLTLPFPTGRGSFERLADKLEGTSSAARARLAEALQMVVSLRLVPGLDQGIQSAFELIMLNREIRSAVIREDWELVEKTMHTMGEKTGMRTLNQCLMNLMLKRKIDLKAGFAESPRPEELDLMLERVGF